MSAVAERGLVPGYTSIFGRIVSAGDVERAVVACLQVWSSTYLAEVERQHGFSAGELARVKSWTIAPSFDKFEEAQLPAVIVSSPGLAGKPEREGDGSYRARWTIGVGHVVSARSEAETHELSGLYAAAHRTLVLQRPSLEGFASGVEWPDESYDVLPFQDWRSLGAAVVAFEVGVENVASTGHGPTTPDEPLTPDTTPWPDWPDVETVAIDVANVPVTDPVTEREEEQ